MAKVHIKTWSTGDWVEVFVNGDEVVQGHSLSICEVAHLLWKLGHDVTREEVTEEG